MALLEFMLWPLCTVMRLFRAPYCLFHVVTSLQHQY
jgi:hypothetical protein